MNLTKRLLAAQVDYNTYVARCTAAARIVKYYQNI